LILFAIGRSSYGFKKKKNQYFKNKTGGRLDTIEYFVVLKKEMKKAPQCGAGLRP
jgi:hypothetical protein